MTFAELKTPVTPKRSAAFRHILVATDFSEASRRALCDALVLAVENHARLSVIHVLQTDWKYAALENPPELDVARIDAERRIRALVDELGPMPNVESVVVKHGPVAEAVTTVIGGSRRPAGHRHKRARRSAEAGAGLRGGGTVARGAVPGDDDWS